MTQPLPEHQLNHLIFGDIERFMSTHEVPPSLSRENLKPVPYIATVGDVDVGFIALFRAVGPGRAVAMVIQYTVRIAGEVVAAMVRNSGNPAYGIMHTRKTRLPDDLAHLQATLTAPRDYREMTRPEIDAFAIDVQGLDKKQIRIMPG